MTEAYGILNFCWDTLILTNHRLELWLNAATQPKMAVLATLLVKKKEVSKRTFEVKMHHVTISLC